MGTWLLGILHLLLCRVQSLVDALLSLRTSSTQSTLQLFNRRWCQEQEARIQLGFLHGNDTLHINVENRQKTICQHILDSFNGGTIHVTAEFCRLDELAASNRVNHG